MDGIQEGDRLFLSLRNQFKALNFSIIGSIIMVIALYFLNFNPDAIRIFGIFWMVITLPALYLHFEYWIENRRKSIQIESDKLILTQGNKSVIYKITNIEKVILYKSASLDKGGIPLSPIESYHYVRIIMKSQDELIITCLLAPKVEEVVNLLKGVKYERRKRPFCTIMWF